MKEPNCYRCKFRRHVAGSAHSACVYGDNKTGILDLLHKDNIKNAKLLSISATYHGIREGWFNWPIDFDPIWLKKCSGFTPLLKAHETSLCEQVSE